VSEFSHLKQARLLLKQIDSPSSAALIAKKAIALIRKAEAEQKKPAGFVRSAKRGTARVEYRVETTGLGEALAEHRPGSTAMPFRCPRNVYDAIVAVLVEAKTPLLVPEIVAEVGKRMGITPAAHQFRPVLRLWMHVKPSLVMRNRSRYLPKDRGSFKTVTAKLWLSLKQK